MLPYTEFCVTYWYIIIFIGTYLDKSVKYFNRLINKKKQIYLDEINILSTNILCI